MKSRLLAALIAVSTIHSRAAVAADPETGLVQVAGGSIYYECKGSGAVPIVFIHGGFGDRRMWDDQFEYFARDHRVVRYDHRGYGRSSAPDTAYSPVDDLRRLLTYLKIEKAIIVGNSMGGTLAIDFTLQHPERVASLVVVSSGPGGFRMPEADRAAMMAVFDAAQREGTAKAVEMWLAHPMVAVTSKDPRTKDRLRTIVTENQKMFLMKYWPSEPMAPAALQRLGEIKVPTMVIVGDRDTPFVQEAAAATAKGITGTRLVVIPGADHLPHMVKPEEFNRALAEFLRGLRE